MSYARSPDPLVPPVPLAVCIACVAGAGALANCSLLAALLKTSRNGLSSIIIQLSVADFLILVTFAGELWFYNTRTWNFGGECCTAYRGLSEFASTASYYLIVTVALHTISTINLEENRIQKRVRAHEEDGNDELRSSHHSLVASSDSSTPPRSMNVDYRYLTGRVRVMPPALFVWALAASLSVPQFVSAITVTINEEMILCTVKDSYHSLYMNMLLATFNLFLPVIIMCVAIILVICKLKSNKASHLEVSESIAALKLSLSLMILYCVFCIPRSIAKVYSAFSRTMDESFSFDIQQLNGTMSIINFAVTATYLVTCAVRPLLSLFMLPKCREQFKFRLKNPE